MFTISDNTPSAGCIQWSNLHMQYLGVTYTIQDGYTNYPYIYWSHNTPTQLVVSNTLPTNLTDADCLLFLNKNGTHLTVPTATILDGDLLVPGSIMASALAANSVTSNAIAADAVTSNSIATGAVTADSLAANCIGAAAISANAITSDKIVSNAVTTDKLAANSVTANAIAANAVTADKIAANAITADKISAQAITADKLASSVGSNLDLSSNTSVISTVTNNLLATNQGTTIVEETDSKITYIGTWSSESSSSYHGGTAKYSSTTNGYAQFSFIGTGINVYFIKSPNLGIAHIYLDGVDKGTLDLYSSANVIDFKYSLNNLAYGAHTIKIVVTGTKNASASNTYVEFDYFEILNSTVANSINFTRLNGCAISGNNIIVSGAGGLSSLNTIGNGQYLEFTVSDKTAYYLMGLSNTNTDDSWSKIQYGIYPMTSGSITIYESGTGVYNCTYNANDIFRIAVEQGQIKYYQNGVLIYTSVTAPTLPLLLDATFYSGYPCTISNVNFGNTLSGVITTQNFASQLKQSSDAFLWTFNNVDAASMQFDTDGLHVYKGSIDGMTINGVTITGSNITAKDTLTIDGSSDWAALEFTSYWNKHGSIYANDQRGLNFDGDDNACFGLPIYPIAGLKPCYTWSGTIPVNGTINITHNLGHTPIIRTSGYRGNVILTFGDDANANTTTVSSMNSSWTGTIYFW